MAPPSRRPPQTYHFVAALTAAAALKLWLRGGPVFLSRELPDSSIFDMVVQIALFLLLPLGVAGAVQSWLYARCTWPQEQKNEAIEFLLGAAGFVLMVLGTVVTAIGF